MKPGKYVVLVILEGWPESPEDLAIRVRRCIETHPTLSVRVEKVTAEEIDAPIGVRVEESDEKEG